MEDLKEHLAEAFRTARIRKGMTQEALAEVVGVTVETISNAERAESLVSLPVFLKLATALELAVAKVLDVPMHTERRRVTAKRRKLEGELQQIGEQMTDASLELLVGISKLVSQNRQR